ncbi:MAG: antibiotic biosynthesis monooxygenase [Lewinellaceae bacterium]|nr:antibiotic biosynthesis monooxygenase [Saprospiraceae bacterium]MCB9315844.1 antibiotic biosynthesis monooxygenase [Lewinellaceae bacterium]MCB9330627.1 antibiotic biosynthesis monooxygenase [Lewinellaceae bacterium]
MIANTPEPPYYAVVFTSVRTDADAAGYAKMAQRMLELAAEQPGFLGAESARNEIGITISYWQNLDAIRQWKANSEHLLAQALGRSTWYRDFKARICLVERDYGFSQPTKTDLQ